MFVCVCHCLHFCVCLCVPMCAKMSVCVCLLFYFCVSLCVPMYVGVRVLIFHSCVCMCVLLLQPGPKKKAQLHGAVWSDLPCPFHLFLYMSVCVLCVCVFMCMCSPPPIPTPAPRRAILMHASWALRCIPRDLSLSLCIWAYGRMCLVAWVDGEVYTQVL